MENENEVIDPEVMEQTAIEKSSPRIPVSIDELSNMPDERGVKVIEARRNIIDNLRRASIMLTSPSDWLLFRNREGAVTAYCQDTGCKRFWQLWGIEINPKGTFEKITDEKTGDFAYRCVADGGCKVTGLYVYDIEGIRYSTEDFCKYVEPDIKKEMFVRLAATANRDGNIIRTLTGMKSVALELLDEVWKGTGKTSNLCSKGKGYGTQSERRGAIAHEGDKTDDQGPICPKCSSKMTYYAAKDKDGKHYGAFWGCSQWKATGCKGSVQDSDYQQTKRDLAQLDAQDAQQAGAL